MLAKKLLIALLVSLSLYFVKDYFQNLFNEINLLHILFFTSISVFLRELFSFLFEYFEEFKLRDSIDNCKSNLPKDNPSNPNKYKGSSIVNQDKGPIILNHDEGSSSKPENSGSETKDSGGKSIADD